LRIALRSTWGVAGAHRGADFHVRKPHPSQLRTDAFDRRLQVDAHVVGQRLQRRDVDDVRFVAEFPLQAAPHKLVYRGEERRQRLARAGRRGDQHVAVRLDRRPRTRLRRRGRIERGFEPGSNGGMEALHLCSLSGMR